MFAKSFKENNFFFSYLSKPKCLEYHLFHTRHTHLVFGCASISTHLGQLVSQISAYSEQSVGLFTIIAKYLTSLSLNP